jgi:hypothetical protein
MGVPSLVPQPRDRHALRFLLSLSDWERLPAAPGALAVVQTREAARFNLERVRSLLARLDNPHLGRGAIVSLPKVSSSRTSRQRSASVNSSRAFTLTTGVLLSQLVSLSRWKGYAPAFTH